MMRKVIVIGCPGAGKSTFSRKLAVKTGLPLYYLDMIWHRPDRTTVGREAFKSELSKIVEGDEWIIDGNYLHTLPMRLERCDTIFFFDIPTEICLEGARQRVGKPRVDMPWFESELDRDFEQWILDFPKVQLPIINALLSLCDSETDVIRFKTREEGDDFIDSL